MQYFSFMSYIKLYIAIIFIGFSVIPNIYSQCRFCDTLTPYKHSIDIQVNRAFTRASIWVDYLLEKSNGTYDKEKYAQAFFSNIRYGYRVLPFLSIGPEFIYENEYKPLLYSGPDGDQVMIDDKTIRAKVGAYARLHGNWFKVFKPYADLGLGYFYLRDTWTPKNQERTNLFIDKKIHKFDFYVGAGMSFMIWRNHFNIDLGAKYSPVLWSNIFSKKVVFTWKLGYNFNVK